jgi:voltage-gated sodium channel
MSGTTTIGEHAKMPWGERIVKCTAFEVTFAALILLNTVAMCIEAEYRGWGTGTSLGVEGLNAITERADYVFKLIAWSFGIIFTVEVITKLVLLRCSFWKSSWNIFDFVIIGIAWVDEVGVPLPVNPMLLRLLRLVRLLRLIRGLSALAIFENLHLMVRGIKAGAPVLLWVVVLILPMMSSCALFLNYTLQDYMSDESKPVADRRRCYEYFGTYTRAMLSMFEVTFANWAVVCRFLYSNVSENFAIFFMVYKLVVGISMLRVIYGVFLHVTFACAHADDDSVVKSKEREIKLYEKKMQAFFRRFDQGQGYLTREQFIQIVENPQIKNWLSGFLELEIHDADLLFDLTDVGGDQKVWCDELVDGFSRLKGQARSIDIIALTRLTQESLRKMDQLISYSAKDTMNAYLV